MTALAPAFADPVLQGQAVFRCIMDAMARPGTVRNVDTGIRPPAPLSPAAGAVALALLDYETPFWLDPPLAGAPDVAQWLRFHTGAPQTAHAHEAAFAFLADPARAPAFDRFALGSTEYPDRSTTLILQVACLSGDAMRLSGPGIAGASGLAASPLPADFITRTEHNRALFPRGVDLILVTGDAVAALPRSTCVEPGA